MGDQKLLTRDSKDSDDINGCSEEDALLLEKWTEGIVWYEY